MDWRFCVVWIKLGSNQWLFFFPLFVFSHFNNKSIDCCSFSFPVLPSSLLAVLKLQTSVPELRKTVFSRTPGQPCCPPPPSWNPSSHCHPLTLPRQHLRCRAWFHWKRSICDKLPFKGPVHYWWDQMCWLSLHTLVSSFQAVPRRGSAPPDHFVNCPNSSTASFVLLLFSSWCLTWEPRSSHIYVLKCK